MSNTSAVVSLHKLGRVEAHNSSAVVSLGKLGRVEVEVMPQTREHILLARQVG